MHWHNQTSIARSITPDISTVSTECIDLTLVQKAATIDCEVYKPKDAAVQVT